MKGREERLREEERQEFQSPNRRNLMKAANPNCDIFDLEFQSPNRRNLMKAITAQLITWTSESFNRLTGETS